MTMTRYGVHVHVLYVPPIQDAPPNMYMYMTRYRVHVLYCTLITFLFYLHVPPVQTTYM